MQTVVDALREIIGIPSFYNSSGNVDYGLVTEYIFAGILLCIVVSSIFKFVLNWVKN